MSSVMTRMLVTFGSYVTNEHDIWYEMEHTFAVVEYRSHIIWGYNKSHDQRNFPLKASLDEKQDGLTMIQANYTRATSHWRDDGVFLVSTLLYFPWEIRDRQNERLSESNDSVLYRQTDGRTEKIEISNKEPTTKIGTGMRWSVVVWTWKKSETATFTL